MKNKIMIALIAMACALAISGKVGAVADSSTNKSRLETLINWCAAKGWAKESVRGAAANACAEAHAWLESGDEYASSKYFDFAVYGGDAPNAGHDWYSSGAGISASIGAYGMFQWLSTNDSSQVSVWNAFFSDGNSSSQAQKQFAWWFGTDGLGTNMQYGWAPGGDVSYTDAPNANSDVSFSDWAKNKNKETEQGQCAIFYANFERAGAGQFAGHTIANLDSVVSKWGIDWGGSGSDPSVPGAPAVTPPKKDTAPNDGVATNPCKNRQSPKKDNPTAGSNGGTGTKPPDGQPDNQSSSGALANGSIPCFSQIVGNCYGSNNVADGQCYGLAQWWAKQCGAGDSLQSDSYAYKIWSAYPWGSKGTAYEHFKAYEGIPSGGLKTGDIICFSPDALGYDQGYGHVGIVEKVLSPDNCMFYDQNYLGRPACGNGTIAGVNKYSYKDGVNLGIIGQCSGVVRPLNFPTCVKKSTSTQSMKYVPFQPASAAVNMTPILMNAYLFEIAPFADPSTVRDMDALVINISDEVAGGLITADINYLTNWAIGNEKSLIYLYHPLTSSRPLYSDIDIRIPIVANGQSMLIVSQNIDVGDGGYLTAKNTLDGFKALDRNIVLCSFTTINGIGQAGAGQMAPYPTIISNWQAGATYTDWIDYAIVYDYPNPANLTVLGVYQLENMDIGQRPLGVSHGGLSFVVPADYIAKTAVGEKPEAVPTPPGGDVVTLPKWNCNQFLNVLHDPPIWTRQ